MYRIEDDKSLQTQTVQTVHEKERQAYYGDLHYSLLSRVKLLLVYDILKVQDSRTAQFSSGLCLSVLRIEKKATERPFLCAQCRTASLEGQAPLSAKYNIIQKSSINNQVSLPFVILLQIVSVRAIKNRFRSLLWYSTALTDWPSNCQQNYARTFFGVQSHVYLNSVECKFLKGFSSCLSFFEKRVHILALLCKPKKCALNE